MIIVSARHGFDDADRLSTSGHQIRDIDLRNDTVSNSNIELKTLLNGKTVLILTHGFNNEHFEVYDAYQIIEEYVGTHLSGKYDYIIGYSWPGGDSSLEWWQAKSRSNGVARMFRRLLEELYSVCSSIDVMSHSLGARVVLKALKGSPVNHLVRNYYCTAAAVDNECLELREEFHESLQAIGNMYVFHSARDGVLSLSYLTAEFDRALGLNGPEDKSFILQTPHRIYIANCKKVVDSHGAYKRCDDVYQYINSSFINPPSEFVTL